MYGKAAVAPVYTDWDHGVATLKVRELSATRGVPAVY